MQTLDHSQQLQYHDTLKQQDYGVAPVAEGIYYPNNMEKNSEMEEF